MFISVSMQLRNHADSQPAKRFKRKKGHAIYTRYTFGMLQVREKEISLRKCPVVLRSCALSRGHWLWFSSVTPTAFFFVYNAYRNSTQW